MPKRFADLKVAHKLMLMSILFLLPDTIMLCMMLTDIGTNIEFARLEIKGNEYLHPLVRLLHLVPSHKRLSHAIASGDNTAADQLTDITRRIEQDLLDLQQAHDRFGRDLSFTDQALAQRGRAEARPENVLLDWQKIRGASPTSDPAVVEKNYDHLLATIRTMIVHAGDMSNLILDPDLDSYYMMDATLLSLPQAQDQLHRAIEDGADLLSRPQTGNSCALAKLHAQILRDSARDHVANSINTSMRESSAPLLQQMPAALQSYLKTVNTFIDLTQRLGDPSNTTPITPQAYRTAGANARDAGIALWEVCSQQLNVQLQRRISAYEQHRRICVSITAMAVLMAWLLVTYINRSINRPWQRQADALRKANADLNAEVKQRQETQTQLVEASRKAGMAEIVAGVLHNVGNVLNSLNTSATVIRERLDESKVSTLGKAAEMIRQNRDQQAFLSDDPKGRQIPELLSRLVDVMSEDQQMIGDELSQLRRNVDHIKHIVQSQQSLARVSPQLEEINLTEAIEDALQISGLSRGESGIEILRDFQPCDRVHNEKHKLLQMLVNLITNAKKAVFENPDSQKRITLSLQTIDRANDRLARITITDTGVGIAPEHLQKLFQHGFTTRKDGHGFGLHSAAIDVHQMGGSIRASSQGRGFGATFTLEIPFVRVNLAEDARL